MTERDIVSLMGSAGGHPAWDAFVREMRGRSYGYEPLTSAWGFFKSGWDARNNHGLFTSGEEAVGVAPGRGHHGTPGHRCSGFCPDYPANATSKNFIVQQENSAKMGYSGDTEVEMKPEDIRKWHEVRGLPYDEGK